MSIIGCSNPPNVCWSWKPRKTALWHLANQIPSGCPTQAKRTPRHLARFTISMGQGKTSRVTECEVTLPVWLKTCTTYVPASAVVTGGSRNAAVVDSL